MKITKEEREKVGNKEESDSTWLIDNKESHQLRRILEYNRIFLLERNHEENNKLIKNKKES